MFEKILITNRGETAFRVIRICMRMGIATVAVYSDADSCALRTPTASEAGAEAIKVETPDGNPVRRFPPFVDADGAGECGVSGTNVPVDV